MWKPLSLPQKHKSVNWWCFLKRKVLLWVTAEYGAGSAWCVLPLWAGRVFSCCWDAQSCRAPWKGDRVVPRLLLPWLCSSLIPVLPQLPKSWSSKSSRGFLDSGKFLFWYFPWFRQWQVHFFATWSSDLETLSSRRFFLPGKTSSILALVNFINVK